MPDILAEILTCKKAEVDALKRLGSDCPLPVREPRSMKTALLASPTGIIAEFKRRSPSKGAIHPSALPDAVVAGYEKAGAAACSVLTDTPFFGGSLTDLATARAKVSLPLLRKDFVIDRRQIADAYRYGADAVLLIGAVLSRTQVEDFTAYAHGLGLEVLFEIHSMTDLDKYCPDIDMVGVNNRNLTTFSTDPDFALKAVAALPTSTVKVAESGLTSMDQVRRLRDVGYSGFLIGETFMKDENPAKALDKFLKN